MIVTCPECAAKYRVSNDAVPPEGSRMRCPACETLFLAKPPVGGPGAPAGPTEDALPRLVGAPMASVPVPGAIGGRTASRAPITAPTPFPAPPSAPGGWSPSGSALPARNSGPVTALFAALDVSSLPTPAAAPLPSTPLVASAPSGLELAVGPRVNRPSSVAPSWPSPVPPSVRPGAPAPARDRPARVAASWVGLVFGLAAAAGGVALFAWTIEAADLDAALMPPFETILGVEPPFSHIIDRSGRGEVALDELRRDAEEASTRGDASAAIVLWSRVRTRHPTDPRAAAAIAKLRTELEDHER